MSLFLPRLLPWLVPGVLWLWLFFHLHYEWTLNPQYNYGWAVPFLAAFLFYLRWPTQPERVSTAPTQALSLAMWGLLLLLFPLRVIEEANPDWRLLSWTLGLIVLAYSLLSILRAGGSAWARHFAFPLCFTLVAVPWPVQFENAVVQGLTRAVAYAAVEIAGWIGVGAFQIGNVIELHNGFVGVNEACSGVKTLQAAIMVALVLGELLQLTVGRRLTLLVCGCAWVFFCNVLRATVLVVIAAKEGTAALGRWHDLIGTAVVIVGMAGLIGIAWFLRKKESGGATEDVAGSWGAKAPPRLKQSLVGSIVRLGWLAAVFGMTELWYRSHETHLVPVPEWQVRWPNDIAQVLPIPEEARAILRFNDAQSAAWEKPRAVRWWGFFARWKPQRTALQLVRSHSPEICLPAVGRTFRRELPPVTFESDALPLRFRVYQFEQNDRPLFVFVCIQEDKAAEAGAAEPPGEWTAQGRLHAAWRGQRNLGQRLLEIAVIGFDDFFRAREAVATTVREIVERTGTN